MIPDLTFITNEKNRSLLERFHVLIKDTSFFDCLVGYFYTSGFHALYRSLEKTEKIRILIGISTNRQAFELLDKAGKPKQQVIEFSHAETKEEVEKQIEQERPPDEPPFLGAENAIYCICPCQKPSGAKPEGGRLDWAC